MRGRLLHCPRLVEVASERHHGATWAVVVLCDRADGEAQALVEADGGRVARRGDGAQLSSAVSAGLELSLVVEGAGQPGPAEVGPDPHEVDVGHGWAGRGHERDEEAGQPLLVLGHPAGAAEVVEEQAGQPGGDRSAPPVVDDGDDVVVVARAASAHVHLGVRPEPDVTGHPALRDRLLVRLRHPPSLGVAVDGRAAGDRQGRGRLTRAPGRARSRRPGHRLTRLATARTSLLCRSFRGRSNRCTMTCGW